MAASIPDHTQGTLTTGYEGADATAAASYTPGPRPGDRIGRYVVEDLLGTGGMGVVVAAHDPELARQVAVKLVRRDAGGPAYRRRLIREARAMARLEHDNVVRVYDAGEHAGEVFVAMELVRGETVGRWMRAAPRPWREVLARFLAAGRGLAAAHRAGLVHRDFKPDNVLVRAADGRVCVTDFGLAVPAALADAAGELGIAGTALAATRAPNPAAAAADTVDEAGGALARGTLEGIARTVVTRPGAAVGTPAYMAPEQHRGADVDARADVFSFCVSLYEGLHGERPFAPPPDGAGSAAWAEAIRADRVRPPPPGRHVPPAIRRALLRGLAADPADRWAEIDPLLAALGRAQRSRRGGWLGAALVVLAGGAAAAVVLARGEAVPAAYADGMDRLRRDDFHGAAAAFERATHDEPDYAPAWVGLARARQNEIDLPRARAALGHALALIPASERAPRLEVEGLAAELDERWDTAIDRYQAYVGFFPADVEVGLALADAQIRGGHAPDALVTVQSLRASSQDVRLELAEAKAAHVTSQWSRMIAPASRAIAIGTAIGAPAIVARASVRRAAARSKLHQGDGALADLEAAGIAGRQAGDRSIEGRRLNGLTLALRDAGDIAGAARAAEQAIAIDRELGDAHNLAADLNNAAAARDELGETDRVRALYRELFDVLRALDDRMGLVHAQLNYGEMLTDAGERVAADPPLREAIRLARAAGAEQQVLLALLAIASNDFGLGNVQQAEIEYRDAVLLAQRLGDTSSVVHAYDGIAVALAARGDRAGELGAAEQAVRLAAQVDPSLLAVERVWHAVALIDGGKPALAIEPARVAAGYLHDHDGEREELVARSAAACALALTGRRAEAEAELALARALLERGTRVNSRTKAATLLVRAAVQLGHRDVARAIVASTPRDNAAVPWIEELAAQRKKLGLP